MNRCLVSYYLKSGAFVFFVQMFLREDGSMFRRTTDAQNNFVDEEVLEFKTQHA